MIRYRQRQFTNYAGIGLQNQAGVTFIIGSADGNLLLISYNWQVYRFSDEG